MNRPFVAGRFSRHSRVNIDQISPKEGVKEGEEEAEEEAEEDDDDDEEEEEEEEGRRRRKRNAN